MGGGERRGRKKKSELTEPKQVELTSNAVNTYNNDSIGNHSIDKSSIDKNSVANAIVNTDTSGISIDKNDGKIDKPSVKKSSITKGKTGANNINANKAKFEEDIKKEPILQTILDAFDGELLN